MQVGVILEDIESGLRLMVVRPSESVLKASDISYNSRALTACEIQPSGQPIEGIRVGMDPGSRSKPGAVP